MRNRSIDEKIPEGFHLPRNRGSLSVPRAVTANTSHYSPRLPRSPKFDGDGTRLKWRKGGGIRKPRTATEGTIVGSGSSESEDEDERKHFPWLNAIVMLNSSTIFLCGHQDNCLHNCHFRQSQSCHRLLRALRTVYSDPTEIHQVFNS